MITFKEFLNENDAQMKADLQARLARRKKERERAVRRDTEKFERKRDFGSNVDAIKAKIAAASPQSPITGGFASPSSSGASGRAHGKIR